MGREVTLATIRLWAELARGRVVVISPPMTTSFRALCLAASLLGLSAGFSGCTSNQGQTSTNPAQPGPAIGQASGAAVGVVAGNVVGAAVGAVEGAAHGIKQPFTNEPHVIRTWRTETTPDGRTIQVPEDTLVDAYGRPISAKK